MILSLVAAASCTSDTDMPAGPIASEGDDVKFTIVPEREARTMYDDDWTYNTDNGQVLYWGNYFTNETLGVDANSDNVRIYCGEAAVTMADYKVTAQTANNSVAASIDKTGAAGIQWGNEADAHTFYAVYPADKAKSNAITRGANGHAIIEAELTNGQSPVNYRSVVGGSTTITNNALNTISGTAYQGEDASKQIVTYGQPDMSAALMVAQTSVPVADYGKPVSLKFNVIADVLDITVNGPVSPNDLLGGSGNGNDENSTRQYIKIQSVTIKEKDGNAICGRFMLDLTDGKTTGTITNGVSEIQLQTAQTSGGNTYYPTLWVRSSNTAENKTFDQLRVRAFLIPGQVTDLSQLSITVSTDCGDYTQQLKNAGEMVLGQIHPINLAYFTQRGAEFQFDQWIAQLDPQIYVNELSLPGTWYSYSYENGGAAASSGSVYCQKLTLAEQYAAGIRAFQFHVHNDNTNGSIDSTKVVLNGTSVTFNSILNRIGKFIEGQHSDEFCVVNISEDGSGMSTISKSYWLRNIENIVNNNTYVYKNEITPNTTIQDVAGKVIVHVNTASGYETLNGSIDALVSRWESSSATSVLTVNMKWGSAIAPTPLQDGGLRLCYTEAHRIQTSGWGNQSQATLAQRESAIKQLSTDSYDNYKTGNHDTWYYCVIGGVYQNNNTAGAEALAKELNPYTLSILSDPQRQACPMGMVMMNYADAAPEDGDYDDPYSSVALIRTIINNNSAFILNKATATSPQANVTDETNSYLTPVSGNSIGR